MEDSEEERHILHSFPETTETGKLRWNKKKKKRNLSRRKFDPRKDEDEEVEDVEEGPFARCSSSNGSRRPEDRTCERRRSRSPNQMSSTKMRFPPHRLKTWPTFLLVTILLFDRGTYYVSGGGKLPVRLESAPEIYKSQVGGNVQLQCIVENLGETVITWYKGTRILSAGELKISQDPRIRLLRASGGRGINLKIRNVDLDDAGEYICEVNLKDKPLRIKHRLDVLIPARINTVTGNGRVTARKGSRVTLNCTAEGNPKPRIHWERQHHNWFTSGLQREEGQVLSLLNITRKDDGVYVCVADNGVHGGQAASARIALNVLYPPEVAVEEPWVHSGIGESAQMECVVLANPDPKVNWYRGSLKLSQGERHTIMTMGHRYVLTISPVIASDFGNYSCVSHNILGKESGQHTQVALTGAPTRPTIMSDNGGQNRYSFHLKWRTQSHYPLLRHRIEFWPARRTKGAATSTIAVSDSGFMVPSKPASGARERVLKANEVEIDPEEQWLGYNLKGLRSGSQYVVVVRSSNEAGWSPESRPFVFTTSNADNVPKELQSRTEDEVALVVPDSSRASSAVATAATAAASGRNFVYVFLLFIFMPRLFRTVS